MPSYTKQIIHLSWPILAENLAQIFMGITDAYLVAQIGLHAVSGVSFSNTILAIYQAVFMALAAAISAIVAKTASKRQRTSLALQTSQAIQITLYLGFLMGIVTLFGRYFFLEALGAQPDVVQSGGTYLLWVGGSILLLGLMSSLSAILRAIGKPHMPFWVTLFSSLLNLLFSAVAIFYLQAGILGVALGTVLARLIGLLLLWLAFPLDLKELSWWPPLSREMVNLALPSVAERLMMRLGDIVISIIIARLGTAVVAGNAIGESLGALFYLPTLSMTSATIILIAKAHGEDDRPLLIQLKQTSYRLAFTTSLFLGIIVCLLSPWVLPAYTDKTITLLAAQTILWTALIGLPASTGTLVYTAVWQGLGRAKLPFYATTVGMWTIRITLSVLLAFQLELGLLGICLATILDNSFRCLFLNFTFVKTYRSVSL